MKIIIGVLVSVVVILGVAGYFVLQNKLAPSSDGQQNFSAAGTDNTTLDAKSDTVTSNTVQPQTDASADSFFLSPKNGDTWFIGKTYNIKLSGDVVKDYHVLTHSFTLVDENGTTIGSLCPNAVAIRNNNEFEWVAGIIIISESGCVGTDNFEIKTKSGKYRIEFNLFDSSTRKGIQRERSGLFSLIYPEGEIEKELFINQPGEVISVSPIEDGYILAVDLLTSNPKWTPGGNEPSFINQSGKIRNLKVTSATKAFKCFKNGGLTVLTTASELISKIQKNPTRDALFYFYISGDFIVAFKEMCLP